MIFYFSGTGNSLYAAKNIARKQGLEIVDIAKKIQSKQFNFIPEDGERIGFVFPIYAWSPPKIVLDFINKLQLTQKNNSIFAVCTCGADAGEGMEVLRNTLMKNQIVLNADFSVVMPDNYILGYDVCSKAEQESILNKADEKLIHINEAISKKQNLSESEKGKLPRLKTKIINPLFNKFANPSKKFSSTIACVSCGFCTGICPVQNITINVEGVPVWGDNCLSCLACLHRCPKAAIQCGARTVHRGRYYNPNCGGNDV